MATTVWDSLSAVGSFCSPPTKAFGDDLRRFKGDVVYTKFTLRLSGHDGLARACDTKEEAVLGEREFSN